MLGVGPGRQALAQRLGEGAALVVLGGASAVDTTERRSRRSTTSRSRWAASARSRHSALRTFGTSFSASSSSGPAGIVASPAAAALGVLLLDGLADGGKPTEDHLLGDRSLLLGERLEQRVPMGLARPQALGLGPLHHGDRRRLGPGAARRAILALGSIAALAPRALSAVALGVAAAAPRAAVRRGEDRRDADLSSSTLAPAAAVVAGCASARVVVTSGSSVGAPSSSRRSGSWRAPFDGTTPVISMPSTKNSASTRSTSPTLASPVISEPATVPRGALAPAARQVHVPSSRELVSSMSILRGMGTWLR